MQNLDLPPEIGGLDALIRQGHAKAARPLLSRWLATEAHRSLSRQARVEAAALCRRVDLLNLGLKLLSPYVRPSVRHEITEALPEEKAEYAATLSLLGAEGEALALLKSIDSTKTPHALLAAAFAHFSRWEYPETLSLLEAYVAHPSLTAYARLVGMVNWAAALVACEQWPKAQEVLTELFDSARRENHALLLGNTLMLSAQRWIALHEIALAERDLTEALSLAASIEGMNALLILKWKAALNLASGSRDASEILNVQARAMELREWETVRDCDYLRAKHLGDQPLLRHLHFGTPFQFYRRRLAAIPGFRTPEPNEFYSWHVSSSSHRGKLIEIDARTGKSSSNKSSLKFAQIPQRLFAILASDFYRPHRLAALHERLFPERHYHHTHSPVVLRQAIMRLRRWFATHQLPLVIDEQQSSYRLTSTRPCAIRVHAEPAGLSGIENQKANEWLRSLRAAHPPHLAVTRSSAAQAWRVSERTAFSRLQTLVAEGRLHREGAGAKTKYRVRES
jgi:hypothetical protein